MDYFLNGALLHSGFSPRLADGSGAGEKPAATAGGYGEQATSAESRAGGWLPATCLTPVIANASRGIDIYHLLKTRKSKEQEGFINLEMLPPELALPSCPT